MNDAEKRNTALNLALMYQRQQPAELSDDDVVKTAEKFHKFLTAA